MSPCAVPSGKRITAAAYHATLSALSTPHNALSTFSCDDHDPSASRSCLSNVSTASRRVLKSASVMGTGGGPGSVMGTHAASAPSQPDSTAQTSVSSAGRPLLSKRMLRKCASLAASLRHLPLASANICFPSVTSSPSWTSSSPRLPFKSDSRSCATSFCVTMAASRASHTGSVISSSTSGEPICVCAANVARPRV